MNWRNCLLSLALAACVAPALAAGDDADPFKEHLLPLEAVMTFRKQIDLTRAQSDQIGKLVVATQQKVAEKQWQMQSVYFDLLEAFEEPRLKEARIVELARAAVDIENDIKIEQIRLLVRLRNLLEPEQIAFLKRKIADGWSEK